MTTKAKIQEHLATNDYRRTMDDMNAAIVDNYRGAAITRGLFEAAFNKVAPKENWKLPIDAEIDLAGEYEIYVLRQAVIFFTASIPEIFPVAPGRYRVMAAGYYEAVGA